MAKNGNLQHLSERVAKLRRALVGAFKRERGVENHDAALLADALPEGTLRLLIHRTNLNAENLSQTSVHELLSVAREAKRARGTDHIARRPEPTKRSPPAPAPQPVKKKIIPKSPNKGIVRPNHIQSPNMPLSKPVRNQPSSRSRRRI